MGRPAAPVGAVALLAALAFASSPAADATSNTSGPAALASSSATRTSVPATETAARMAGHGSITVDDHARLRLRKAFGAVLLEEGSASGTLPGRTTVKLVVRKNVTASFTIQASNGSITGTGGASLHSTGRFASFGGWLKVSRGTGRYAHAHGAGRLYGVIDRRRHSLTVTTTGMLHY